MEKIIRGKDDIIRSRNADYWLWDYRRWKRNWDKRKFFLKNPEKYRLRTNLAMRRHREKKQEFQSLLPFGPRVRKDYKEKQMERRRNKWIRIIYWHEIKHPEIPIRAYL
jgi:hypothetical protein